MKTGYTQTFSGTTLAQYLLSNPSAFRVDLFTITLASGSVLRTTTFQTDLLLSGNTFYASKYGMWSRGSITASTDCTQDSEIQVTVSAPLGTLYPFSNTPLLQTVASSIFDKARITIQTAWLPKPFNANNVTPAPIDSNYVATKFVGDIVTSADPLTTTQAVFKVSPLPYMLQEPWPRAQVQPGCRYSLFDQNCTLNKASFAQSTTVAAGSTQLIINLNTALPNASPYYEQGFITFTSGQNQGLSATISKQLSTTELQLSGPLLLPVTTGDAFTVYPGCDKTLATCTTKINNAIHFPGAPFVPEPEKAVTL